ncbi:putative transposase [Feldmannia species virus]|uniref:Putative transposase n=1 Tax=Feldmannia species virus TaxID=39420 RepID=B5LW91_9PHYC|nr:transposase [Feldmannia species virus]ACH46754.1 putative transposase [Feldmannia species virus]
MKDKGVVLRCRKVRILPSEEQREILKSCFGIHRHIYNECVKAEKDGDIDGAGVRECYKWRKAFTTREDYYGQGKNWKDDCPSHTKQQAVEEFFKNKKTGLKLVSEGKIRRFDIGFKSRFKCRQETIPFEKFLIKKKDSTNPLSKSLVSTTYKGKSMDLRIMGKVPKVFKDRDDQGFTRTEMKITRTKTGKYYAIVSFEVPQTSRFPEIHGDMISFDPGCKTFQTYHSPDGTWGEIGTFEKQELLLRKADRLKSRLELEGKDKDSRWRRRTRRRMLNLFEKVRNRTADLHNKVCSWVVNTYRLVLVPEFKTSQMVSSKKLYSKTCRKMMTWSHYRFRSKLIAMAQKFTDVKVRLCNEAYTTKQCGSCGVINRSMTLNDRSFNCVSCGLSSSRDGHAARNVGLRSLRFLV